MTEAAVRGLSLDRAAACPGSLAYEARLAAGCAAGAGTGQPDLAAPFRHGLVATSDNMGYTGSPPTHPELLEFLATLLAQTGWSAKACTA